MSTKPRDLENARKNIAFLYEIGSDASDGDHEDYVFRSWADGLMRAALNAPSAPSADQIDHVKTFLGHAMDGHGEEGLNEAVESMFAFLDAMAPAMHEDGEEYEDEDEEE